MTWKPTTIPWERCSESRREKLAQAWVRGDLSYKFDPVQYEDQKTVKRWWRECPVAARRWGTLDCARRYGKDTMMFTMGSEICIRRPKSRVPYGAPTQVMVGEILEDVSRIFSDCPPQLAPKWVKSASRWEFPNGSIIPLVGFDLHPERARGRSMDAWFLTEPGFFDDLDYAFKSVLMPQAFTSPHAVGLMGSTPPTTPAHSWSMDYIPTAKQRGRHIHRTIWDNPRVDDATKKAFIAETGGEESSETQREWYARHVADSSRMIVPEFHKHKEHVVVESERPRWFDGYVSLDPGMVDLCAGLAGYYDFERAKIVIEGEFAEEQANTARVNVMVKELEAKLWKGVHRYAHGKLKPQPFARYSDVDLRLIADLQSEHGLTFQPTAKDNLDAQVNAVRLAVQQHTLEIHPRCTGLIAHLEHGIWNKSRTKFEKSSELGHFDLLAALIYFVRNVSKTRNPNPPPDFGLGTEYFVHPERVKDKAVTGVAQMFQKPKKSTRPTKWRPTG